MDLCGHLMKQCFQTKEFIQPQKIVKITAKENKLAEFTKDDNQVNLLRCQKKQFYDQKICRHLCSQTLVLQSTRTVPISPCESICFELTRSSDAAGEVCPTQKYCSKGCPCPFYECEKLESRQKLIPLFDIQLNSTQTSTIAKPAQEITNGDVELITGRWEKRKTKNQKFPIILSDFSGLGDLVITNASSFLFSYERFS